MTHLRLITPIALVCTEIPLQVMVAQAMITVGAAVTTVVAARASQAHTATRIAEAVYWVTH
jgi:hypothetical protein